MGVGVSKPFASVFLFCVVLYKTSEMCELWVSEQWPASNVTLHRSHLLVITVHTGSGQSAHPRRTVEVKAKIPEALTCSRVLF